MSFKFAIFLLGFWSMLFQNGWAQNDQSERMEILIAELDSVVEQKKSYVMVPQTNSTVEDITQLFNKNNFSFDNEYPQMNLLEAQRQNALQDWGLALEAGYLENLEGGVFDAEGIFYNRRYRLGMKWDILNNGWQENRLSAKQLKREIHIEEIEHRQEAVDQQYELMQQNIVALMRKEKDRLRSHYREILEVKQKELKEMYDMGYKSWDEVIQVSAEISKTDMMLEENPINRQVDSSNARIYSQISSPLPVLSLDLETLGEAAGENPSRQQIDSLRIQNIKDEHRPWREISLSANLNYNFYDRSGQQLQLGTTQNREYFSLGINLSVPLSVFRGGNELYEKAQREESRYENNLQDRSRIQQLNNYYTEYEQLKIQYAETYLKYLRQADAIAKKGDNVRLANLEYSPSEMLDLFIVQLETMWELKDQKQKLYLKLLQIDSIVPEMSLSSYAKVWSPPALLKGQDMASGVYIWSKSFNSLSNNYLLNYLSSRQFETVLLSPGKLIRENREKITDFIEEAHLLGIDVHLMKGSNVIIREENWPSIKEFAETAKQYGARGIHLDVEPHTFEDWENNQSEYLSQYVDMVEYAGSVTDSEEFQLSLSVPVFYDSILTDLKSSADQIYVMAYGSDDVSQISQRLSRELNLDSESGCGSKLVVSLRPGDFKTESAMQDFMANLDQQKGEICYALHDLNELVEFN